MSQNKLNLGYSTVELLIGLLLMTPLILAALSGLQFVAKSALSLSYQSSALKSFAKLDSHFLDMIREQDQNSLSYWPIVHKQGRIKFKNGLFNPISLRTDLLRPAPNSDAITGVSIHIKNTFIIKSVSQIGADTTIIGCPKYGAQLINLPSNSPTYLLINAERAFEFEAQRRPWGSPSNKCLELTGQIKSGMINDTTVATAGLFARVFVPIERIYTIYVDAAGRPRYLGHRDTNNIENQPLAAGPIGIRIKKNAWPSSSHTSIEVEYQLTGSRKIKKFYSTRLPQSNYLNWILN